MIVKMFFEMLCRHLQADKYVFMIRKTRKITCKAHVLVIKRKVLILAIQTINSMNHLLRVGIA